MSDISIDTGLNVDYPDWLYRYATEVTTGISGFDAVTDADIQSFHERGYLVIHDAFTATETQSGLDGLVDLIVGKNPDFNGVQVSGTAETTYDALSDEEKQDAVRKLFYYVEYDDRLKALAYHPTLLNVLNRIIGYDDITMFQDMALIKPPRIGREKPWHQDMAYFNVALDTIIVGVWIALDEATIENGCMMVIPGSHKNGAVLHFQKRDWQICDTDVYNDGAVAVPLKPGSLLMFHGLIHHGTPANRSDHRRRALQFHYRAQNIKTLTQEERLAIYGTDGKDVTC